MSSGLLRQAWRCYRDFGADESLLRFFSHLKLISEASSLDFFICDLESFRPDGLNTQNIREISKIEFEKFRLADGLRPRGDFDKQFSRGSRLMAATAGDTLVGINWINTQFADLTQIRRPHLTFPKDTLYSYGLLISSGHRSKGIGRLLKQFVLQKLKNEGWRFAFIAAYVRNIQLSRWHEKNGFARWGRVFYWKFLGKERRMTRLTKLGRKYPRLLSVN